MNVTEGWSNPEPLFNKSSDAFGGMPYRWVYTRGADKISLILYPRFPDYNETTLEIGLTENSRYIGNIFVGIDELESILNKINVPLPEGVYNKWEEFSHKYGGFKGSLQNTSCRSDKKETDKKLIHLFGHSYEERIESMFSPEEYKALLKTSEQFNNGILKS